MKLTDKCKEDFERWYNDNNGYKFLSDTRGFLLGTIESKGFYSLEYNMQFGVYQDFFYSNDIYPIILPITNDTSERMFQVYLDEDHIESFDNIVEARVMAISKGNELYNEGSSFI